MDEGQMLRYRMVGSAVLAAALSVITWLLWQANRPCRGQCASGDRYCQVRCLRQGECPGGE